MMLILGKPKKASKAVKPVAKKVEPKSVEPSNSKKVVAKKAVKKVKESSASKISK